MEPTLIPWLRSTRTFAERKREIARKYREAFEEQWPEEAFWMSGVVTDRPIELIAGLVHWDIEAKRFWKPLHLQAPYKDFPRDALPVTEGLWKQVVCLPCSTNLTNQEQGRVIVAVLSSLREEPTGLRSAG